MATTIISRAGKGSPLTVAEHDANHQNAANTADSALNVATPTLVPWSTIIPLNAVGAGKYMATKVVDTNMVLAVGPAPVHDGNCNLSVVGDGVHNLDISALATGMTGVDAGKANNGFVFLSTAGQENLYSVVWVYGHPYCYGQKGFFTDLAPPLLNTATVENASKTTANLVFNEPMNQLVVPAATDFSFSTGHLATAFAFTGPTTANLTFSAAFTPAEVRTLGYIQGSNKLQDLAGNFMASFSGHAIINNVSGSTVFSDTFDRTDANPMSITSSGGGNWSGNVSSCQIQGGKLLPNTGTAWCAANLGSADGWVQCDITVQTGGYNGLNFRGLDNIDTANCCFIYLLPNALYIGERTSPAGDNTLNSTALSLTPGSAHTVRIEFVGSSIVIKLDGSSTPVLTVSTPLHASNTWAGPNLYGFVPGGAFDNFSMGT